MLESLDRKYGSDGDYDRCFSEQMVSLDPGVAMAGDSWHIGLAARAPQAHEIPDGSDSRLAHDPEWHDFRELEETLEAADWHCRRDIYDAHLDDVRSAIESFTADHGHAIAAAQVQWRDVEARAARLGYVGQTGSLD